MENVQNNQARLLMLQLGRTQGAGGKAARERLVLRLVPGANAVDAATLERANAHPMFQVWKKKGLVTLAKVAVGKNDDGSQDLPESLAGMTARDAIGLVKATTDMAALERWQGIEERATVVKAVAERIEELGGSDENDDGSQDDESDDDTEE
jgi:hypothetical protein